MTAALNLDPDLPRCGPGRPRKPSVPKLPAYRPPIGFMDHPARFGSVIWFWFSTTGMKPSRAIRLAASIANPSAYFERVPKAGWDKEQRRLGYNKRNSVCHLMVSATMPPETKIAAAVKSIRRCAAKLGSDPEATDWVLKSGRAIMLLRARNGRDRWLAERHLLLLGWPGWLVDRLKPI